MNKSFEVIRRNAGHWDINKDNSRIAFIRTGPKNSWLLGSHGNEYFNNSPEIKFPSIESCMSYVYATLMKE